MNLQQKLPYAISAIRSISRHTDEGSNVRLAYLEKLENFIEDERKAMIEDDIKRIKELESTPEVVNDAES